MTRDSVNGAGKKLGRIIGFFARKPDCIYFIDVPSQVCLERLKARDTVLFHTNRRIKGNRLLKNKDLYYLNKMRYAYKRLFAEPKKLKVDNILQLDFGNDNIADTKNIQGDMRMQKKEIENRICAILKNYCQYNSDHISTDCDLRENYGVDSLILVELLVDIEAVFGITFDSEMLSYEHFSTVASLAEYIYEKGGEEQKVGCL
jgi:acyl carrier protein